MDRDNPYAAPQRDEPARRSTWTILDLIRANARAITLGGLAGIAFVIVALVLLAVVFFYWSIFGAFPTG